MYEKGKVISLFTAWCKCVSLQSKFKTGSLQKHQMVYVAAFMKISVFTLKRKKVFEGLELSTLLVLGK